MLQLSSLVFLRSLLGLHGTMATMTFAFPEAQVSSSKHEQTSLDKKLNAEEFTFPSHGENTSP